MRASSGHFSWPRDRKRGPEKDPANLLVVVMKRSAYSQDVSVHIFNQHLAHIPRFIGRRFGNLYCLCQVFLMQGGQLKTFSKPSLLQ